MSDEAKDLWKSNKLSKQQCMEHDVQSQCSAKREIDLESKCQLTLQKLEEENQIKINETNRHDVSC